ncbi:MAG: glycosyl hydrolase, partial [bacterium]
SLDPILIGTASLDASQVTVSDHSDWTATMNWTSGDHQLEATAGIGMPFVYLTKESVEPISITVADRGTVTINNEMLIIEDAKLYSTVDFVIYAPTGSTWVQSGSVYTSTLNDKNYLSIAMIPLSVTDVAAKAVEYKKYAYVFPKNTTANYSYNESTSVVRTTFTVETDVKEGTETLPLIGLLPHQWGNLASDAPALTGDVYDIIRGELKTMAATEYAVENTYYGIIPTLPAMGSLSPTFDLDTLNTLVDAIKGETLETWTDSYNDGQLLNRLIQTARVAAEIGNTDALNSIKATIKERVEDWLSFETGEVAFLFYYIEDWSVLVGYPSGHSQDSNINDHHFHWGYFIHAAAFLEQYEPGWADQWGDMVNMLVRDAACSNRGDDMFPYLRNFSPYHGHCWANGFATFPQGNDQESTSESMQFNSSLIYWGTITGNDSIRDLGIYLYTTEQTAVEEYWFDVNDRTFSSSQEYALVSRLWGNSLDNGTFWTSDIAASYGIELYPIHGGSLYLGHQKDYIQVLWDEIKENTGITTNEVNADLWHDTMWKFAAFVDPNEALSMYNSYPERSLKFGVSAPHTYYWLHSMVALGEVSAEITADYPVATVFNQNGRKTYVAQNYTTEQITVSFSDGYQMQVPAQTLYYEQDGETVPQVSITSPKSSTDIYIGDTVLIQATAIDYEGEDIVEVSFYIDGVLLSTSTTYPYEAYWYDVEEGTYTLSATTKNSAGKEGESKEVVVSVVEEPIITDTPCFYTSDVASSGSFTNGYTMQFSTSGTSVTLTAELLDTARSGVVAYLWVQSPFSETQMTSLGNQKFQTTVTDLTVGEDVTWGVKFAYSGGMSVTSYFTYTVGVVCEDDGTTTDPDTGDGDGSGDTGDTGGSGGSTGSSTPCSYTSDGATQGSFSSGYTLDFSTDGTTVTFIAELLDTDRSGIVAYKWVKSPFSETQMTSLGDQRFEIVEGGLTVGEEITWGVKFAYSGGMSVTDYFTYTVGNNCDEDDSTTDGDGGTTTDVDNIGADAEIVWSANSGLLTIECCTGESLAIYNVSGICVYRADVIDNHSINLNRGVYILQIGEKAVKIVMP